MLKKNFRCDFQNVKKNLLIILILGSLSACQPQLKSILNNPVAVAYSYFDESDGWQIWSLDLHTLNTRQLTHSNSEAYYPALSKSGVLFYSDHNGRLWSLVLNPTRNKRITEALTVLPKHCGHPAVSPDGHYLACVCFAFINRSEDSDLFLVDLLSGKAERLYVLDGLQKHPAWSPDSKQIVFSSGFRQPGQQIVEQLWVMNIENKIPVKIIDNGYSNIHPAWSPDGRYIAYASDIEGSMDIWVYDFEQKRSERIVDNSGLDVDPVWRHDKKSVIFVSTREGNMGLWEVGLEDNITRKLLILSNDIHEPLWMNDRF